MSEPASISSGIAARYATAIFELSGEEGALDALEADTAALSGALEGSAELRDLIASPVYPREQIEAAIGAVAEAMGLHVLTTNTLRLMAQKRRLFVLPALLSHLRDMIAEHKGEVTADVASAKALTKAQSEQLAKVLSEAVGKTVKLNATVDESLIGGLVVKVGSKMIDTSIRARLDSLRNTMKEVG